MDRPDWTNYLIAYGAMAAGVVAGIYQARRFIRNLWKHRKKNVWP